MDRRDVLAGLTAFAALAGLAEGQASEHALPETMAPAAEAVLGTPRVFAFASLPVVKNANGETRAVTHGVLPTGETVELHETSLLAGHMPHPAHRHRHSEFMLVREGTIEFDNDGVKQAVGPGGVVFAASNVMHGLKNVGEGTAQYFVLAIGKEA